MKTEVQEAIDRALAAGRQVAVVFIGGEAVAASHEELHEDTSTPPAALPSGDPSSWTPLERLEAAIAAHGDGLRKEDDWTTDVCGHNDFSGRELERARKNGALPHSTKEDGLDAGAKMIAGGELKRYLELRLAVRQGRQEPPEWWEDVVPKKFRRAA